MLHYIRIDLWDYSNEKQRVIVTTTINNSRQLAMNEIWKYAYIYAHIHNCKVLSVVHLMEETI